VLTYKTHFNGDGEHLRRIVETEIEQGSREEAMNWVRRGIKDKVEVRYDSQVANEMFAVAKREHEAAVAAAEAEKKRRAEQRRRVFDTAKTEMKACLDGYNTNGVIIFTDLSVRDDGSCMTATVTVTGSWHILPYGSRLETAGILWRAWSTFTSASKPGEASLSLVDRVGNEVGGSRGSGNVWAQDK
jgi:hypothetical protein